jgi:hypothetical protein
MNNEGNIVRTAYRAGDSFLAVNPSGDGVLHYLKNDTDKTISLRVKRGWRSRE